jgi:hypothetical protein
MMTLAQAVRETMRLQAEVGAPLEDIECSSPTPGMVLCYVKLACGQLCHSVSV